MVVTVEYWVSQNGDVRVTYYGPVNTYTMIVAGHFGWHDGYDHQPSASEIQGAIEYLIGIIAPQDNNPAHDYDTVVNWKV